MTDERECLHCGQTKAEIKRNQTICGIEGGYEYRELEAEWPRHRWADWTDRELARQGVRPEAFERHRRTSVMHMQWIPCDDHVRGHNVVTEDDPEWFLVRGQCAQCGKKNLIEESSNDE